jgi:hypothetical protein
MKRQLILCCITLIAIAPICFGQASPAKSGKSASNESAISDLEKSAWEAYKNKQADAFKALLSKDYCGVYADGVKTLDVEVADMAKTDLRDYSFADVKVMFPHPKVAVINIKRCNTPLPAARTFLALTIAEAYGLKGVGNGLVCFIPKPRRSRLRSWKSEISYPVPALYAHSLCELRDN